MPTYFGRIQTKYSLYISLFIWGCIAFILAFTQIRLFHYAEDDAYIHFRIARNLLDHGVPYFNIGDPINASSSISWTLLVSALFKLIARDPLVIAIANSLITTTGAFLWGKLLQRLTSNSFKASYYWFFVCLYIAVMIIPSISLMETPLAMLLLVIGLLLLFRENPICFAVFGGMVFTRLEFVVLLLAVLVYCFYRNTFSFKAILSWLLLGTAPFVAFALVYWGTIIPNTVIAKAQVYSLSLIEVAVSLINSLFPSFWFYSWGFRVASIYKFAYTIVLVILVIHFIVSIEIRKTSANKDRVLSYLLLVSGVAIICAYFLRKVLIFRWYVPLYTIPILFALYRIIFLDKNKLAQGILLVAVTPWLFSLLGSFSQVMLSAFLNDPYLYPNFVAGARVRKYLQIGEHLYKQYPDAALLTSEIGGLGYSFPGYIIDGAGLVSPQALQFHPMKFPEDRDAGNLGAIPIDFIEIVTPEIIVSYDVFIRTFLRSDYNGEYIRIKEPILLDDDLESSQYKEIWGSRNMNIFIRKDIFIEGTPP